MPKSDSPTPPKKRPRGRPRKNPLPEKKPDLPPELDVPEVSDRSSLEWARSVQWAVENLNKDTMPKVKVNGKWRAPNATQKALWDYGQLGERERRDLVVTMTLQALRIIAQQENADAEDEVAAAEEKAVAEIDELLEAAIEESQSK